MPQPGKRVSYGQKRNHVIPKLHLRRFGRDGKVYLFDLVRNKEERNYKANLVSVNDATVQKGIYTDNYEQTLSKEVENFSSRVLDNLEAQAQLTIQDRILLSQYIHAFHYRTHKMKAKMEAEIRQTMLELIHNSKRRSDLLVQEQLVAGSRYFQMLAEMGQEWIEDPGFETEKSSEFFSTGLDGSSLSNEEIPCLLASLPWRILEATDSQFVLGDAFFEYNALDQPIFEKYVPLNSRQCLLISRFALNPSANQDYIDYIPITSQTVAAINTRIVKAVERYVVSAQNPSWIAKTLKTPTSRLSRIRIPQVQTAKLMGGFISKRCPTCFSAMREESVAPFLQELKDVATKDNEQHISIEETFQYACSNRGCGFRTDFTTHGSRDYPIGTTAHSIDNHIVRNHLWEGLKPTIYQRQEGHES